MTRALWQRLCRAKRSTLDTTMKEQQNSFITDDKKRLSAKELSFPLFEARRWMYSLGTFFVGAGIALLSIGMWAVFRGYWQVSAYFVIAIGSICQGVLLFSSATAVRVAHEQNSDFALFAALARLRIWFMVMGWVMVFELFRNIVVFLLKRYSIS